MIIKITLSILLTTLIICGISPILYSQIDGTTDKVIKCYDNKNNEIKGLNCIEKGVEREEICFIIFELFLLLLGIIFINWIIWTE